MDYVPGWIFTWSKTRKCVHLHGKDRSISENGSKGKFFLQLFYIFGNKAYKFLGASGQSPLDVTSTNLQEEVANVVQIYTGEGLNEHNE